MFPHVKLTKTRVALVEVSTTEDWLTAGGDSPEDEGWKDIESLFPNDLEGVTHAATRVKAKFIEWRDE